MNTNFQDVGLFMKTFGQKVRSKPEIPDAETVNLRIELISEELNELWDACEQKDIIAIADALTDILYVTYGAGHAFGINLDDCFKEVQKSNMSKLDDNGQPIYREDGKIMKGPHFQEPDFKNIFRDRTNEINGLQNE